MTDTHTATAHRYRIGAVAKLTGVSVHTLRKWEDRYDAVTPARTTGGERAYSQADVERLQLIKRLVDRGLPLREVARQPMEALHEAMKVVPNGIEAISGPDQEPVFVLPLDSLASASLKRRLRPASRIRLMESDSIEDQTADVLLLQTMAVQGDTRANLEREMQRRGVSAAVVLYGFSTSHDLGRLQAENIATVRTPADADALEDAIVRVANPKGADNSSTCRAASPPRPPRLSRDAIARVAGSAPKVHCECPHHLADIILSLLAFEDYSAACEDKDPADAALHHYLWRTTGQARAMFEDAIERIAHIEGISLLADAAE